MDTPLDLWGKITTRLTDARFSFYDGEVPTNPASAYVVGYPNPGSAYQERYAGGHNRLQFDAYLVCVGRSTSQCLNTVRIVRDLLIDWRPDDSLPASALCEEDDAAPLIKDESPDQSDIRWSYTLHYRMYTSRS